MDGFQVCTKCKTEKPRTEFRISPDCKRGTRPACKECERLQEREHYKKNAAKFREKKKKYADEHRDQVRNTVNRYRERNKSLYAALQKQRRRRIDVKICCAVSAGMRSGLKGRKNSRHWETLVGYTRNDLIKRLKATLPNGVTWNDYVTGKVDLHIDHIIPVVAFNFETAEDIDFKRCWALSNLRLLPAKDNIMKRSDIRKPFQPSLRIAEVI